VVDRWAFGTTQLQLLTCIGFLITIGIAWTGFRTFERWHWEKIEERRTGRFAAQTHAGVNFMSDMDEMTTFLGRAGNLYGRKNLCPPFHLMEFAQAWVLEGISLSHCIEQISAHLDENSGRYRGGSGGWGLRWLDQIIRKSWYQRTRPPRALPARTDRLYQKNIHEVIADPSDLWIFDVVNQLPSTAQAIAVNPIDKAREPWDVPRHPSQMGTSPRPASDRADTAPNPVQPISLKPIDKAEAFLRRELGERRGRGGCHRKVREGRRHRSPDIRQGALPPQGRFTTHRLRRHR
jgi:hypothetical protein